MITNNATQLDEPEKRPFGTLTYVGRDAVLEISNALRQLLADVFGLYVKTKNFPLARAGN